MRWREFSTGVPHQGIATIVREVVENTMGLLGAKTGVTDNASINVLPHPEPRHAIALTGAVLVSSITLLPCPSLCCLVCIQEQTSSRDDSDCWNAQRCYESSQRYYPC